MKSTYDVVIVGGAVIGSAVAYFLAANPDFNGSVLVVERDPTYRFASTSLSSSSIRVQFSNPINVKISQFGSAFIKDFAHVMQVAGEAPPDLNFHQGGYLFLANTKEQARTLRENHAVQRACGADVVLWDQQELHRAFPHLFVDDILLASYGRSGEGWFSNTGLMNGFKAKARDLGADAPAASREQDLRNWLGSFNFSGDMVTQSVGSMSGGEKARLVLAMIVWQRPNLLLLDEPTNHLDLPTREALAMALNDFDGTVLLVSHDRHLLRAVADDFWLVGRGQVGTFDGDLDDYQRYLLEESRRLREAAKAADAAAQPAPAATAPTIDPREARRLAAQARQALAEKTKPLKKELEKIDTRMAQLGAEKAALEEKLATPLPPADIAEAGKRLKAVGDELDASEERWLELSEAIEQLTQAAEA